MILPERVLGRPGANCTISGEAIGPISLPHPGDEILAQLVARLMAVDQGDIGENALALDVVREADDGGLGHAFMRDERAFDLGRAHAMAGNVDHIIDAAGDPIIAVRIAAAAITGEIFAREGREIGLDEAVMVADRRCASGRARNRR